MWLRWQGMPEEQRISFSLAGDLYLTLAMAGPKPFHKARTPSAAMVLRAQSTIPV